jgi:hypothetical protein
VTLQIQARGFFVWKKLEELKGADRGAGHLAIPPLRGSTKYAKAAIATARIAVRVTAQHYVISQKLRCLRLRPRSVVISRFVDLKNRLPRALNADGNAAVHEVFPRIETGRFGGLSERYASKADHLRPASFAAPYRAAMSAQYSAGHVSYSPSHRFASGESSSATRTVYGATRPSSCAPISAHRIAIAPASLGPSATTSYSHIWLDGSVFDFHGLARTRKFGILVLDPFATKNVLIVGGGHLQSPCALALCDVG